MLFGSYYTNWGWGAHRLNSVAEYITSWPTYATQSIFSNGACVLGRDSTAGSVNYQIPSTSILFENDVWLYQDLGSLYYDQCQNAAAKHGASIITPYTVGLTGDNYWLSSTHQCNTYEYIFNSGTSMGNENVGVNVRSSIRYLIYLCCVCLFTIMMLIYFCKQNFVKLMTKQLNFI